MNTNIIFQNFTSIFLTKTKTYFYTIASQWKRLTSKSVSNVGQRQRGLSKALRRLHLVAVLFQLRSEKEWKKNPVRRDDYQWVAEA